MNLYGFVDNDGLNNVDILGLKLLIMATSGKYMSTQDFSWQVMTGFRQVVGNSGAIGVEPVRDADGNLTAWKIVIRSENSQGKCNECWVQLKQAIETSTEIRVTYAHDLEDNANGETTGAIRKVQINPLSVSPLPEVSLGYVYTRATRRNYNYAQPPFAVTLWHEAIGHSALGFDHPGYRKRAEAPWNYYGTESAEIDPTIAIENMARECLRRNGFNVNDRYPKYNGVP